MLDEFNQNISKLHSKEYLLMSGVIFSSKIKLFSYL